MKQFIVAFFLVIIITHIVFYDDMNHFVFSQVVCLCHL